MTDNKILEEWHSGRSLASVTDLYLAFLKEQHEKHKISCKKEFEQRKNNSKKQRDFIRQQKKLNKKYKFDGEKIVVGRLTFGKPPTVYQAQNHVEKLLLSDWKRLNG